jgi:hypothetical protein
MVKPYYKLLYVQTYEGWGRILIFTDKESYLRWGLVPQGVFTVTDRPVFGQNDLNFPEHL